MSAYNDPCQPINNITCLPFGSDLTGIDPDRVILPFQGVNYTSCNEDLLKADLDKDGKVSRTEYSQFVTDTAARKCIFWPALTLGQKANFNSLACQCVAHQQTAGLQADVSCCQGPKAHLPTSGAANPAARTEPEAVFLQGVCLSTDQTLPTTNCSIKILPIAPPPPPISETPNPRSGATANGTTWNLLGPLIASLLLLLLCCCCCCVVRRRRLKEFEEEEIIETEYPGKEEWLEQPLPEQAPRAALVAPASVPRAERTPTPSRREPEEWESEQGSRGRGYDDDDESDGSGRRRRGGNLAPEEEEKTKRKWPTGEFVPPTKTQEKIKLRHVPQKEPAPEPEWDEPQRDIDELKYKDDDSAQVFDPYNPDGGVVQYDRPDKDPVTWKNEWEKGRRPEDEEVDARKHRIQGGLGAGEVWDRLDEDSASRQSGKVDAATDAFDWVVKSALRVLEISDKQGHLETDDDSTVPPPPDQY